MDHSFVVDIDKSLSDVPQLEEYTAINEGRTTRLWMKTYEPEPIDVWMCLHKFHDVSIYHPLRYHCELSLSHRHTYQRQHIWMPKVFPHHHLLAEPLRRTLSVHRHAGRWNNW